MAPSSPRQFLEVLGHPGKYAWIMISLLVLNYFPVAFNHLVMGIYGAVPPHRCRLPDNFTPNNDSIPQNGGKLDSCHVWANYTAESGQKVKCPEGWNFTLIGKDSTMVNEFSLVCDRKYIPGLSTTIYFAGVMVGGLVCGSISDITGRRVMMIATMYLPILLGIMVYLVESVPLFMVLRFCIGFLIQGLQICTFVIASEFCATGKARAYCNAMFECFWSLGVMTLAGIAYLLQDWRYIQLGITLPAVLSLIYVWALPESFRWLLQKRRFNQSLAYLKRAARINKVEITPEVEQNLKAFCTGKSKDDNDSEKTHTLWDAFKTPNMRKNALVMFYVWLATSMGYYGLSLQASRFTGDKYLNYFINGAVELPAYVAAIWIISIIGRRYPLCFYFLVGGVSCILAGVIPKQTGDGSDIAWVSTMLGWIGKFSTAGCWSVLFLYSAEIFPTPIRNAGLGACAFWARVGSLISPQINLVADYSHSWIPVVVFGCALVLGGLLTLLLPETKNSLFPDTLEQAENLGKEDVSQLNSTNSIKLPDNQNTKL